MGFNGLRVGRRCLLELLQSLVGVALREVKHTQLEVSIDGVRMPLEGLFKQLDRFGNVAFSRVALRQQDLRIDAIGVLLHHRLGAVDSLIELLRIEIEATERESRCQIIFVQVAGLSVSKESFLKLAIARVRLTELVVQLCGLGSDLQRVLVFDNRLAILPRRHILLGGLHQYGLAFRRVGSASDVSGDETGDQNNQAQDGNARPS